MEFIFNNVFIPLSFNIFQKMEGNIIPSGYSSGMQLPGMAAAID